VILAFCWAHVRRDVIRVGKGWPQSKKWALEWLQRIRVLYRLNDRRLAAEKGSVAFREADGCLRRTVAGAASEMANSR
jgi:transposase